MTQCPIQTGHNYVYNFTVVGQRGTLFWHAHVSWLRATLYGPIIILPKHGVPYPFAKPYKEVPIIFGADLFSCCTGWRCLHFDVNLAAACCGCR